MTGNKNQNIAFSSALAVLTISFLFIGNFYVEQITQDYTSRINTLERQIDSLESDLEGELSQKQNQLDTLSDSLTMTGERVQTLEDTSGELDMQLGELSQQVGDLAVESESFSLVISEVIDSVVSIHTNRGQGSGAFITSDGLIVTNHHVIEDASFANAKTYDGKTYALDLVGFSERNDIAVLSVRVNETFQDINFGDSDDLLAGQKVVALGNPAGLAFTATEGIVSSPERLAADNLYYIQTDATLNPGNSGGPLINSRGQLVGIVDFKVAGYEELGFAIPSNRAEDVIEDITGRNI